MNFATKNNSKVSLLMTCESVFCEQFLTPLPLLNWSTYLRHLYEQKYHYSTQAKTELGCISLITLLDINSQQGQVVSIIVSKIAPEDLVPPIVCKQQLSVCLSVCLSQGAEIFSYGANYCVKELLWETLYDYFC